MRISFSESVAKRNTLHMKKISDEEFLNVFSTQARQKGFTFINRNVCFKFWEVVKEKNERVLRVKTQFSQKVKNIKVPKFIRRPVQDLRIFAVMTMHLIMSEQKESTKEEANAAEKDISGLPPEERLQEILTAYASETELALSKLQRETSAVIQRIAQEKVALDRTKGTQVSLFFFSISIPRVLTYVFVQRWLIR